MITRTIKEIASDVATLLGDSLLLQCQPEESPYPDMESRVRICAPGIIRNLVEKSDPSLLYDGITLVPDLEKREDESGVITLPRDYLKLVALKMKDWDCCVSVAHEEGQGIARLQGSRYKGIRGTKSRPVILKSFAGNGERVLRIFPCGRGAEIEYFIYQPYPEVSAADTLQLPQNLYAEFLGRLADTLESPASPHLT